MITEIVRFPVPGHLSKAEVLARARETVARWRAEPELVRKYYVISPDGRRGAGIYLWLSRAAAERAHDAAWRERAAAIWGAAPKSEIWETQMVLDNASGEVIEA